MKNLDFDLYKKEFDKIKLSDLQKEKLKADLLKLQDNKVISIKSGKKKLAVAITSIAASLVIILSLAFAFSFNSQENLKDFSVAVCLENNLEGTKSKNYKLSEKDTIITKGNKELSLSYKDLSVMSLEFKIKYEDIKNLEIKSEKRNIIGLTYYKTENDLVSDFTKSCQKLEQKEIEKTSKLSWMPSDKNLTTATKDNIKEKLSDTVKITVIYKDNTKFSKNIEITFDDNGNYVARYKNI